MSTRTTAPVTARPDPLAPVREALLGDARGEAARLLAAAAADRTATLTAARAEAEAILEAARAQGRADAEALLGVERARVRRQARSLVLAAQRATYEDLRAAVRLGARRLRADPAYARWRDGLAARARATFGADAVVTEPPEGGVVVEAGTRRAADTLDLRADAAVTALGPDLDGLWS
ncbi:MAG: hypothetical protein ACXVWU_07080 [Nocardioides sp.]